MKQSLFAVATVIASVMMLSACQTTGFSLKDGQANLAEGAAVTTEWGDGARYYCNTSVSPAITGSGVPVKGVATVKAWMVDLDYLPYQHRGGIFDATQVLSSDGKLTIPQDAIAKAKDGYYPPCSTVGPHVYQFTVYFLNAAGEVIGIKKSNKSPRIGR